MNIENLLKELTNLKKQAKTIVTTNGCFDILHVGHVRYLKQSKALGDVLVVLLNSDSSVRKLKGNNRPINNQNDRAEVLLALESVDYVVIFEEDTPKNMLEKIKPDIHTKGGDYTVESLPEAKVILENGGKIEFIDFVAGKSTTETIERFSS